MIKGVDYGNPFFGVSQSKVVSLPLLCLGDIVYRLCLR